jgi:hypothetical protein
LLCRNVLDPSGKNPKDRPMLVIADVFPEDEVISLIAISSSVSACQGKWFIKLPFHPNGTCYTGLKKDSFAAIKWFKQLPVESEYEQIGYLKQYPHLKLIVELFQEFLAESTPEGI